MAEPRADAFVRKYLALGLSFGALTIVLGLGIACLVLAHGIADPKERADYAKDILSFILPVVGTWIGTVIAFYFSKEGFEAATQNSLNLVKQLTPEQRLATITIAEGMIPLDQIDPKLSIERGKTAADYRLKADLLDARLDARRRERLPVLDEEGCVVFIAHRSLIDKFIVRKIAADANVRPDSLTLKDMAEDPETGRVLKESFRTLPLSATLADAKRFMDTVPGLSDVFVTLDGTKQTKVTGWVTNVRVLEKSKA